MRCNRFLLLTAMCAEGFVNFEQEWWHFTYPDVVYEPMDIPLADVCTCAAHAESVRVPRLLHDGA